jgi:hypothetical protein
MFDIITGLCDWLTCSHGACESDTWSPCQADSTKNMLLSSYRVDSKAQGLKPIAGYLTVLRYYKNVVVLVWFWTDWKSKNLKSKEECWTLLRFHDKRCAFDKAMKWLEFHRSAVNGRLFYGVDFLYEPCVIGMVLNWLKVLESEVNDRMLDIVEILRQTCYRPSRPSETA